MCGRAANAIHAFANHSSRCVRVRVRAEGRGEDSEQKLSQHKMHPTPPCHTPTLPCVLCVFDARPFAICPGCPLKCLEMVIYVYLFAVTSRPRCTTSHSLPSLPPFRLYVGPKIGIPWRSQTVRRWTECSRHFCIVAACVCMCAVAVAA